MKTFNTIGMRKLSSTEMMKSDFSPTYPMNCPPLWPSSELCHPPAERISTLTKNAGYIPNGSAQASRLLYALVTNILQINRLENQKIKPALHPFNLSEALCRCILNYESELDEKKSNCIQT